MSICPKCSATSGNDWSQCGPTGCPMRPETMLPDAEYLRVLGASLPRWHANRLVNIATKLDAQEVHK